jgi:uncharacterized protein
MSDTDPGAVRLWGGSRVPPGGVPPWTTAERQRIHDTLLSTRPAPYPCHFGSIGERAGTNHYTYLDLSRDRAGEIGAVAAAVSTFLATQRTRRQDRLSLLIMVGPPERHRELAWYRELFWTVLSELGAREEVPRPAGLPADPDDARWNFPFAGEPLFVFGTCPAYGGRRSRVLADCLVIGLQSMSVFHGLGGGTAAGRAAKRRIRRSLGVYEDVPLIADSGDGTGSTVQKWKQYFPEVDGRPLPGKCPMRVAPDRQGRP